jgi:hypothetical protein
MAKPVRDLQASPCDYLAELLCPRGRIDVLSAMNVHAPITRALVALNLVALPSVPIVMSLASRRQTAVRPRLFPIPLFTVQ